MNIGVIGAGSWGTTLANLLAKKGYQVTLWAYEADLVKNMQQTRQNDLYLPGFELSENLSFTSDLAEAAGGRQLLLLVPPSQVLRSVMTQALPHIGKDCLMVSASKGIENNTLLPMAEVLGEVFEEPVEHRLAFLSGPSFAREVAEEMPTAVAVASANSKVAEEVQDIFSTDYFRVYRNDDVVGVELGGALKNVIAGAQASTFSGLAGMGDLVLTCTGDLSRNRTVGMELGRGKSLEEILSGMNMVAEGVKTTLSTYQLASKLGIEMPLTEQMYLILYETKEARQAVSDLMLRELKPEAH